MLSDSLISSTLLAGRTLNRNIRDGSSGTRYINRDEQAKLVKKESRLRILSLFSKESFPDHLRILTFPSTNWIFEGMLINNRCNVKRLSRMGNYPVGKDVYIVSIEREEAIYRSALNLIPGVGRGFRSKQCPPYANSSIRTYHIKRYLRCEFNELANSNIAPDCKDLKFNGAWLDLNGCINLNRKDAIENFIYNHTDGSCRLVITAMNGRYDRESNDYWGHNKLNSISEWLVSIGGKLLYKTRYFSNTSMLEIAIDFK